MPARFQRKLTKTILVMFIALCGAWVVVPGHAQAAKLAGTKTFTSGITITPLRSYPELSPGQTTAATFELSNETNKTEAVELNSKQFLLTNEDYDYRFADSNKDEWIHFSDTNVVLAPQEKRTIAYTLAIPAGATPGGYYLSILATTRDQLSKTNITNERRVASLLFVKVNGKLEHNTALLNIDLPWLTFRQAVDVSTRVTNRGNIHERVRLPVQIRRWPGNQTVNTSQLSALIVPATVRKLSTRVSLSYWPGIYKVQTTLAPAQGGLVEKHRYVLHAPLLPTMIALFVTAIAYRLIRQHETRRDEKPDS